LTRFAGDELKELVRSRTDIVAIIGESVTLQAQRGGREFTGLCPFHDDHNPSLRVYPDRQSYRCWVCDAGGDCFSFVMQRDRVSFPEALEILASRAHIEIPRFQRAGAEGGTEGDKNRLFELMAWAEQELHDCLLNTGVGLRAREYLEGRGISRASIMKFRLGYHPQQRDWLLERARGKYTAEELVTVRLAGRSDDNRYYENCIDRVLFPIRDAQRRPVAFGGRILPGSSNEGKGKYWNPPESPLFYKSRFLYALDHARDSIVKSGTVVVVEGYTDCVVAHQYGLSNFVATLGTALNDNHVIALKRFARKVVLVLDGDEAGIKATERALPRFLAHEVDLRIQTLPDALDPADFLIQRGGEALVALLDQSVEAWEQKFRTTLGRHGLNSIDARHHVLEEMLESLSQVPVAEGPGGGLASSWQMRENVILGQLAQRLHISEASVRERLGVLRRAAAVRGTAPAQATKDPDDANNQQPAIPLFPRNPTRDDLAERELLEIIFVLPETVAEIRREIALSDIRQPHLATLLELCFQLHDQGIPPTYERVTSHLEDAGMKNLAAQIDQHARDVSVNAELAENLAGPQREARPVESEGLAADAKERLRQAAELHRMRASKTTLN
jgi:DNA primase